MASFLDSFALIGHISRHDIQHTERERCDRSSADSRSAFYLCTVREMAMLRLVSRSAARFVIDYGRDVLLVKHEFMYDEDHFPPRLNPRFLASGDVVAEILAGGSIRRAPLVGIRHRVSRLTYHTFGRNITQSAFVPARRQERV